MPTIPIFTPAMVFTKYGANGFPVPPGSAAGVGGNPRKPRVGTRPLQILQSEIELVIAHHHGVVTDRIHGEHHRVVVERRARERQLQRRPAGRDVLLIHQLERRALNGVAAIDQQRVGILGAAAWMSVAIFASPRSAGRAA